MRFQNKVIAGLAGLFGILGASVASASSLEEIAASTYMLYGASSPHCSAVAVSPTQFMTAQHCVEDTEELNIRTVTKNDKFEKTSEEVRYLKVLRSFKPEDVAFLELLDPKTSMPNTEYVDIMEDVDFVPKFGDPLIVVGYPMVVDLTITSGEFTGLVPLPMDGAEGGFFKTTVPVTGGNSGGGLYAPMFTINKGVNTLGLSPSNPGIDYKLIGMTSAGYRNVSFMSYFSTPKSLDKVMKGLLKTNAVSKDTDEDVKEERSDGKLINPADLR